MKTKKTKAPDDADALYDAVRQLVAEFRAAHGGIDPTRAQVQSMLKKRRDKVCVAMNRLEEAEATHAARLAALPDMPERVREASQAMAEQIWSAANESASVALAELRRHTADSEHRHSGQMQETMEVLASTEDELEDVRSRAEAAEADLSAAREEIARLGTELSRAHAKLEDRAILAAMFRAGALKPGPIANSDGGDAVPDTDATIDENGEGDDDTPSGRSAAKDRNPPRKNTRSRPVAGAVDEVRPPRDEPLTGTLPIPGLNLPEPSDADGPSE